MSVNGHYCSFLGGRIGGTVIVMESGTYLVVDLPMWIYPLERQEEKKK